MVYTYTYTDCANHTHVWKYTYTIATPDFTLPVDGASTVNCPADAVAPSAVPVVKDACGNTLTPVVVTPSPIACNGSLLYTSPNPQYTHKTHMRSYTCTNTTPDSIFFNDTATTEIYTRSLVGSVRCV